MTSSVKAPTLGNYFLLANRLREAIRKNRRDTEFADDRRTIVYLTDTNMAEFYLRGEARPLQKSMHLTRLMTPSAAATSQDLTLKFILSGKLPGQKEPLLMSPSHWNEIVDRLRTIKSDVQTRLAEAGNGDATNPILSALQALPELKRLAGSPGELISKAEEIGLSKLLAAVRHASEVQVRMDLAFRGREATPPKLRGIERTDWWSSLANLTRTDDFRQWRELLVRHKLKSSDGDRSRNIDADAQTLAGIEALYREKPESIGDGARIKFLFITADRAIIRAASERERHLNAQGIENFVRDPLVYIPLINFSALYKSASGPELDEAFNEAKEVFVRVEEALTALFPFDHYSDRRTERRRDRWNLKKNIKHWSAAAETIALVNAKLFTEGTEEDVANKIAEIFSSDDIVLAAGDTINSKIAEIKEDHTLNMSMVALDHLVALLEQRAGAAPEEIRAPTKVWDVDLYAGVRQRIGRSFRSNSTFAFLNEISVEQNPDRVAAIVEALAETVRENWEDPVGQLLASTIYLEVRAWESAASCANRCHELAGSGPKGAILRREAAYCRALSLRMTLRSEQEVQDANTLLSENIANGFGAEVIQLRDAVERWTLLISACVDQTIHELRKAKFGDTGATELLKSKVAIVFDQEVRNLDNGIQRLLNDWLGTEKYPLWLVSEITRQAAGNRLGAELLRYYLEGRISDEPPRLGDVLAETEKTYELLGVKRPLPHPVPRGYLAAAEFEVGKRGRQEVLAELSEICASPVLTDADKAEFKFIRSMVASKNAALPSQHQATA